MLILQCANNACHAFSELPTSGKIVCGKTQFYDINRRSALAMRIIRPGRASLTKFCAVMNMPGPVAKKSFTTHVKAIARVSQQVAVAEMQKAVKEVRALNIAEDDEKFFFYRYFFIFTLNKEKYRRILWKTCDTHTHTQTKYMHIIYKFLLWKARNIILNTAKTGYTISRIRKTLRQRHELPVLVKII